MRIEPLGISGGGKSTSNKNFKLSFGTLFEEYWKFKFTLKDLNLEGYSQKYDETAESNSSILFEWKNNGIGPKYQQHKTNKDAITDPVMNWEELEEDGHFIYEGTLTGLRNKKLKWT